MLITVMLFDAKSDAAHLIYSSVELGEMCILKKDTRRRVQVNFIPFKDSSLID